MSENINGNDKKLGAEVVFRKFIELNDTDLRRLKIEEPNRYIATVAEWAPAILNYFDESMNARESIHILQDVLNDSRSSSSKCRSVIDGLKNASLRVSTKTPSKDTQEYYQFFFESRNSMIYADKKEEVFYVGNDAPKAIWCFDGGYQAEMAMGIVRKTMQDIDGNAEMMDAFVYGMLIKSMVVEDYPEFDRWLKK